jgi:hypothetical protein
LRRDNFKGNISVPMIGFQPGVSLRSWPFSIPRIARRNLL